LAKTRTKEIIELLIISILGVVATVGAALKYSRVEYSSIPFIDQYFFLTLALATICSLFFLCKKWRWEREIVIFFLLWLFLIFFQGKDIRSVSIWLDEDFQIWTSLYQLPIEAGWNQHQPPLHFALLGGWLPLLGLSEFSVRLFTLIFSASGAAMLAFYLRYWLNSWWPVVGILPLYLFHPYIIRYSYEVRPIALGLFCMIVWFGSIFSYIWEEGVSLGSSLPIAVFTFFSLISLGFQPPIFGFAVSLAVLFSPIALKNKCFTLSAMFFGFLIYLPIQIYILRLAPPRFSRIEGFSIIDLLNAFSWKTFLPFINLYLKPIFPFVLVVILLGLMIHKDWRWLRDTFRKTIFFSILLGIVFFFALPFFSSYLDWHLHPYYFLAVWPILIFLLVYLLQEAIPMRIIALPALIFALLFLTLQLIPNPFFRTYSQFIEPRADMRGALQEALQVAQDGKETLLFPICGGSADVWCPSRIVGSSVYLNERSVGGLKVNFPAKHAPEFLVEYSKQPQTDERIIWLFQQEWSGYSFPRKQLALQPAFQEIPYLNVVLLQQAVEAGDSRLALYEGLKKFEEISRTAGRDAFWLRVQLAIMAHGLGYSNEYSFWKAQLPKEAKHIDAQSWLKLVESLEKSAAK
jgi:hypothetical protein